MDLHFEIHIDSITKKEYVQAATEPIRRMIPPMLIMVSITTIVISFIIQNFSYRSLIPPFVIALIIVVIMWIMVYLSWGNYSADTAFSYVINEKSWELTLGDEVVSVKWYDTARITVRRQVVLLYNKSNRSNLIPRRCLTNEEVEQMRQWFAATRETYKYRQKEEEERYRAELHAKYMDKRDVRRRSWWRRK